MVSSRVNRDLRTGGTVGAGLDNLLVPFGLLMAKEALEKASKNKKTKSTKKSKSDLNKVLGKNTKARRIAIGGSSQDPSLPAEVPVGVDSMLPIDGHQIEGGRLNKKQRKEKQRIKEQQKKSKKKNPRSRVNRDNIARATVGNTARATVGNSARATVGNTPRSTPRNTVNSLRSANSNTIQSRTPGTPRTSTRNTNASVSPRTNAAIREAIVDSLPVDFLEKFLKESKVQKKSFDNDIKIKWKKLFKANKSKDLKGKLEKKKHILKPESKKYLKSGNFPLSKEKTITAEKIYNNDKKKIKKNLVSLIRLIKEMKKLNKNRNKIDRTIKETNEEMEKIREEMSLKIDLDAIERIEGVNSINSGIVNSQGKEYIKVNNSNSKEKNRVEVLKVRKEIYDLIKEKKNKLQEDLDSYIKQQGEIIKKIEQLSSRDKKILGTFIKKIDVMYKKTIDEKRAEIKSIVLKKMNKQNSPSDINNLNATLKKIEKYNDIAKEINDLYDSITYELPERAKAISTFSMVLFNLNKKNRKEIREFSKGINNFKDKVDNITKTLNIKDSDINKLKTFNKFDKETELFYKDNVGNSSLFTSVNSMNNSNLKERPTQSDKFIKIDDMISLVEDTNRKIELAKES